MTDLYPLLIENCSELKRYARRFLHYDVSDQVQKKKKPKEEDENSGSEEEIEEPVIIDVDPYEEADSARSLEVVSSYKMKHDPLTDKMYCLKAGQTL